MQYKPFQETNSLENSWSPLWVPIELLFPIISLDVNYSQYLRHHLMMKILSYSSISWIIWQFNLDHLHVCMYFRNIFTLLFPHDPLNGPQLQLSLAIACPLLSSFLFLFYPLISAPSLPSVHQYLFFFLFLRRSTPYALFSM